MDRMQIYEAKDIVNHILYVDKNEREMDRYKLFVAIQSNSKRKIELTDVCKLPWDDRWLNKSAFEYNEKEDKEYGEKADNIADMLNSGKLNFESINL